MSESTVETPIQEPSFNMTDEEFLAMEPPGTPVVETSDNELPDTSEEDEAAEAAALAAARPAESANEGDPDDIDKSETEKEAQAAAEEAARLAKEKDKSATPTKPEDGAEATAGTATPTAVEIDYKAEYERILAPFKANGKEVAVKSAEDAIALMQMGAGFNKKMAALKPNLRLMKLMETNGLLDEDKLSYLIDLDKKNPGAINKLLKDSGIDPLDLDADKAVGYKPTAYAVDEREIALDTVVASLKDSPMYDRTLEVVAEKWDRESKQEIAQTPEILRVINGHMETGVYDIVEAEVERERMFGRLGGISDVVAYQQVGDRLNSQGAFKHLFVQKEEPAPKDPVIVAPNLKKAEDEEALRNKRRAASSTKPAPTSKAKKDFNPLSLSDEEFEKLSSSDIFK